MSDSDTENEAEQLAQYFPDFLGHLATCLSPALYPVTRLEPADSHRTPRPVE
jgi:hypothetical protein